MGMAAQVPAAPLITMVRLPKTAHYFGKDFRTISTEHFAW